VTDPADEDAARASLYALLARLFYRGPDRTLLSQLAAAGAVAEDGPLAGPWTALGHACAVAIDEPAQEYEDLFLGPGQAEVSLYLGRYWTAPLRQSRLVALKQDMAALGAARHAGAFEPEDHAAAVFDLMRLLASRPPGAAGWAAQQRVFQRYLAPAYPGLCDAISGHAGARFYRLVASVCTAFLDLEAAAFNPVQ